MVHDDAGHERIELAREVRFGQIIGLIAQEVKLSPGNNLRISFKN